MTGSIQSSSRVASFLAALVASSLLTAGLASAGPDPETKCQFGKEKAVGKYFACRANATSKARKKGTEADFEKCDTKLADAWAKIESKAGVESDCGGADDLGDVSAEAAECLDERLIDVDGEVESSKCVVAKQKAIGKFFSCYAAVVSKATKKGTATDFSGCEDKFINAYDRADTKFADSCPTSGDVTEQHADAEACADGVLALLAPPSATTTTTTTTSTIPPADQIFADNFESGDLSRWDAVVPRRQPSANFIAVSSGAALAGQQGLELNLPGASSSEAFATANFGETIPVIRVEFLLEVDPLDTDVVTTGSDIMLLDVGGSEQSFYLTLFRRGTIPPNSYGLALRTKVDGGGTYVAAGADLRDGRVHRVAVEWSQETGSNTQDGVTRLLVDGAVILEKTDVQSSTLPVNHMDFGVMVVDGEWQAVVHVDNVKVFSTFSE